MVEARLKRMKEAEGYIEADIAANLSYFQDCVSSLTRCEERLAAEAEGISEQIDGSQVSGGMCAHAHAFATCARTCARMRAPAIVTRTSPPPSHTHTHIHTHTLSLSLFLFLPLSLSHPMRAEQTRLAFVTPSSTRGHVHAPLHTLARSHGRAQRSVRAAPCTACAVHRGKRAELVNTHTPASSGRMLPTAVM
jgi:hypothetical protein